MSKQQQGFTLIELVAVIVILGALAVVALPRFINLQDEAREAALDGVVGAAGSAHAVNLAGALASDDDFQNITSCDDTEDLMDTSSFDDYTFGGGDMSGPTGTREANCFVTQTSTSTSATFTGYYVSE